MKKRNIITFLFLLIGSGFIRAQVKSEVINEQKKLLINSWYESPNESKGNEIVFRTEKHKFQAGVDVVGYAYSEMTIKKNEEFVVDLWKWCSSDNNARSGKWTLAPDDLMSLDFSSKTCQCEIKILELKEDKLKVEIKQK